MPLNLASTTCNAGLMLRKYSRECVEDHRLSASHHGANPQGSAGPSGLRNRLTSPLPHSSSHFLLVPEPSLVCTATTSGLTSSALRNVTPIQFIDFSQQYVGCSVSSPPDDHSPRSSTGLRGGSVSASSYSSLSCTAAVDPLAAADIRCNARSSAPMGLIFLSKSVNESGGFL